MTSKYTYYEPCPECHYEGKDLYPQLCSKGLNRHYYSKTQKVHTRWIRLTEAQAIARRLAGAEMHADARDPSIKYFTAEIGDKLREELGDDA